MVEIRDCLPRMSLGWARKKSPRPAQTFEDSTTDLHGRTWCGGAATKGIRGEEIGDGLLRMFLGSVKVAVRPLQGRLIGGTLTVGFHPRLFIFIPFGDGEALVGRMNFFEKMR